MKYIGIRDINNGTFRLYDDKGNSRVIVGGIDRVSKLTGIPVKTLQVVIKKGYLNFEKMNAADLKGLLE